MFRRNAAAALLIFATLLQSQGVAVAQQAAPAPTTAARAATGATDADARHHRAHQG